MTKQVDLGAIEAVAKAIHRTALEGKTDAEKDRLWAQHGESREKRKREAYAAIVAYESWLAENEKR
jgi:hypothetical protein